MDRDVGSVMDGPAGQTIGDDAMNHSDDDPSQDDDRRALQAKSDSRSISRSRSRSPQQALPEKVRVVVFNLNPRHDASCCRGIGGHKHHRT